MTYDAFSKKLEETVTSADCTETTGDFQCDQTGGYPTCLCVCWEKGVVWLMLRYDLADDGADLSEFEQGVADFGIRKCEDIEQFNAILKDLGEDAYDIGCMPSEEETESITMEGI